MKVPSLKEIAAMSDDELRSLLGQDQALDSFKEELTKMQALPDRARNDAENRLQDRLTPKVDGHDLRWIREDALRATSKKASAKEVYDDVEPAGTIY